VTRTDRLTAADFPVAFGRYTLLGVLGEGGMARVFRAELAGPSGFRKPAAVKVVRAEAATGNKRKALVKEARLGGFLHHPNVVETYDFGEVDGQPFIAMELVRGTSLDSLLAEVGRFPPSIALQIAIAICDALEHAHALTVDGERVGLVHRDLKPGNVLVSHRGVVKVADFGIAKATGVIDGTLTQEGMTKGTPFYMSPEQASGQPLDGRSDLFALGTMLYEMVTGQRLNAGESLPAIMMGLITVDERLATSGVLAAADGVLPGLSTVLGRVLKKDVELRHASANELADDLRRLERTVAHVPMRDFLEACGVGVGPQDATAPPTPEAPTPAAAAKADLPPTLTVQAPVGTESLAQAPAAPSGPATAPLAPTPTTPEPPPPPAAPRPPRRPPPRQERRSNGPLLALLAVAIVALGVLGVLLFVLTGTEPSPEPVADKPEALPAVDLSLAAAPPDITPAEAAEPTARAVTGRAEPTPAPRATAREEVVIESAPTPVPDATPEPLAVAEVVTPEPVAEPTPEPSPDPPAATVAITSSDYNRTGKRGGKTVYRFDVTATCPDGCRLTVYTMPSGRDWESTTMEPAGDGAWTAEVRFGGSAAGHIKFYFEAMATDGQRAFEGTRGRPLDFVMR